MATTASNNITTNLDPYNWPMPTRADLMSLSTITKEKDLFRNKTAVGFTRARGTSQNMQIDDIEGKLSYYELVGAKPKPSIKNNTNRPEFLN